MCLGKKESELFVESNKERGNPFAKSFRRNDDDDDGDNNFTVIKSKLQSSHSRFAGRLNFNKKTHHESGRCKKFGSYLRK